MLKIPSFFSESQAVKSAREHFSWSYLIHLALGIGLVFLIKAGLSYQAHGIHESTAHNLAIIFDLAFLALFATFGGKLASIIGIAPMAGKIIMGIIAGPAVLSALSPDAVGIELVRTLGVLLILFEAGLHFDMDLLKKNIKIALLVAIVGVFLPLIAFSLLSYYVIGAYYELNWVASIFIGGIFTATSVGLAVEALKRAGKLESSLGNKIIGAAVIDDILGVVILTTLSKISSSGGAEHQLMNPYLQLALGLILFFGGAFALWKWKAAEHFRQHIAKEYFHSSTGIYTRYFFGMLVTISGVAFVLGLEPVLGAFAAGVILSTVNHHVIEKVSHKMKWPIYLFVGGFLVSIGTMLPREALISLDVWLMAAVFTVVGFLTKYAVKYLFKDKTEGKLTGLAMAIRGEVGLVFVIVALNNNALPPKVASAALLAVILVTVIGAIFFQKEVDQAFGEEKSKDKISTEELAAQSS